MKKELFKTHVKKQGVTIIPSNNSIFDRCILNDFRALKNFIKYIDFDCQFNSKGGCKETPTSLRCCCYSCYENAGFFRVMIDTDITKYSRHFSVKTGFWRKGRGCVLLHKMRSTTCLTHHCNRRKQYYGFGYGIMNIRFRLQEIRDKI